MTGYNFPTHINGDTFLGVNFTLTNKTTSTPIDIAGTTIVFDFISKTLSIAGGEVEITDAAAGQFSVKEQIIDWAKGTYRYSLTITWPSGKVRTYLRGQWQIL